MDMNIDMAGMERGMVDGVKDPSRKWNSYWRECGVCHPDFQPQYIIHLEHYRQDLRVTFKVISHYLVKFSKMIKVIKFNFIQVNFSNIGSL